MAHHSKFLFRNHLVSLGLLCWAFQAGSPALSAEGIKPETDTELVNHILEQPDRPTNEGMCFAQKLPELPDSLKALKLIFSGEVSEEPRQIRAQLAQFTLKPSNVTLEIDAQSTYYQQTLKLEDPKIFHGQEKLSEYVGASAPNLRLVSDPSTRVFFETLFKYLVANSGVWNPTKLSRSDLFHSHIVYNQEDRDLLIVFHSKEYVEGEPSIQPGTPRRKFLDFFGESLNSSLSLSNPTPQVTRRNFIWSLKQNRICGVDTTQKNYIPLSVTVDDPAVVENPTPQEEARRKVEQEAILCTLDQGKVSDLGDKGSIADIYYFPNENVPLFLDFQRKIGE